MTFKAVIFDMGGVAVRLARHQKFVALIAQAYQQPFLRQKMFDFYEGKVSFEEVVSVTNNVFDKAGSIQDFENADFKEQVGTTDTLILNAVRCLQAQGYKVGLLTNNGYWSRQRERSMIIDEADQFDAVVESCRVGFRKPQPQIYKIMLDKLNVFPSESIMVDDSPLVLEAAHALGMGTVLVENQDTQKAIADIYRLLNGEKFNALDEISNTEWKKRVFA
ncbi:unnamed protein product [Bursaphelenchus xylophilus]|uniref:(pine wood nematode) hypothetical protein n=1 Tax=Bursaphelenchus xylophilus TaxID=6326 RepID=A0A1I7RMF5_BURXY|nr:unnamed protein product [Bursaphelenchus xylophilus]CAG9118441.1 unnamed protein product [Bursaphelenchus xylophilus]